MSFFRILNLQQDGLDSLRLKEENSFISTKYPYCLFETLNITMRIPL